MVNPACSSAAPEATDHALVRSPAGGGRARGWLIGCLIAASVAACAAKPPQPTAEQRAAARRQQEQQEAARIAAEQDALARRAEEQARRKKEQAEANALPPEFGTPALPSDITPVSPAAESAEAGAAPAPGAEPSPRAAGMSGIAAAAPVYVPRKLPPPTVPGAVDYDKAFPHVADRVVRVGIVSGTAQAPAGQGLARMLSQEERKYMEDTLGLGIRIAYVSETDEPPPPRTRIGYRPGFLKAAVQIAALLPKPQQVDAMSDAEAARHNVDVLVRIGTDLR